MLLRPQDLKKFHQVSGRFRLVHTIQLRRAFFPNISNDWSQRFYALPIFSGCQEINAFGQIAAPTFWLSVDILPLGKKGAHPGLLFSL